MPTEIITNLKNNQMSGAEFQNKSEEQILAENGFYWREKDGVKVLICRTLEEKGFVNGFSTRIGGASDLPKDSLNLSGVDIDSAENVAENRRRFLQVLGANFQIATAWQVHGDNVKIVKSFDDTKETGEKFDALVSNIPGVLTGVKTADCVPVLIGDFRTKAFAAIHAGWRGTAAQIVPKTIAEMRREFGARADDLTVALGAAALACCYEIGQEVIDAFAQNFQNSENLFVKTLDGHALVDLHRANREQLLSVGVLPENIFAAPFCTMESTDLFFSYRIEKNLSGKTGRLLSVIGRQSK